MVKGIIGKKLGMTSLFTQQGEYMPVTVVQAGPCLVTQIKTVEKDGYNALQLGFQETKPSRINKPMEGHLKKSGQKRFAVLREVPVDKPDDYRLGQVIGLEVFKIGERVNVTGTVKGRGFSGVIKRHGFHGGRKSHGSKSHRIPGSIGCSASPSRVFKGKKLPGHYGNDRKTVQNLEIIDIRPHEHLLLLKGPVPGHPSGLVSIRKPKLEK
ncbi:MAG: 50S ribosomal protein L3 [Deltaproteobacteria bacterium]|nr:50S ribosomal protein L3 [Deltaproteobacteria bacterium]MBW1961755.1 50S ribosomal protein L3 [Deltaproteobacteria bacterium]MBW1995636.1 50S ribosomal protein L3 [Deltaproteobacteria bacterium]MBW2151093.1 50S ribosomal protein L3 [Deltaproteobacteria bacterium]